MNRRLYEHEAGKDQESYTYSRRPLELVFVQPFNDIVQAIAFEKQVKKWSKAKKEALIKDKWEALPELARKKIFKKK